MTVVRPARAEDDPDLQALDAATWSWVVSPAPRPPHGRRFFDAATRPDDVLVAVVDGVVAGYVALGPVLPLAANRHVLELKGLAVDPGQRRRGIGASLVRAAVEAASARGARRLRLRVLAPNQAARALYEACGFEVEGVLREEFRLEGRYVDDVLMARDVTSARRPSPPRRARTSL